MLRRKIYNTVRLLSEKMGYGLEIRRYSPFRDVWKSQQLLLQGVQKPIIFDVGAHIGTTLKRYALLFPQSIIHCFEPFPHSFEKLQVAASSLTGVRRISLHPVALADQVGERNFYISRLHSATNSLFPRPRERRRYYPSNAELTESVTVKVNTLDHFCRENGIAKVNILKMDIQGGELLALQKGAELLSNSAIDLIYTEVMFVPHYDNSPLFHELARFLAGHGYSLYNIYNLWLAGNGQLRYGDAIFVSAEMRRSVVDAFPPEP